MHAEQELNLRKALTDEVAGRLFEVNQGHELLRYVFNKDDDQAQREFRERFGIPHTTDQARKTNRGMIYAHIQYQMALCEACKDPGKKVVVKHTLIRIIQRLCRTSWILANIALMGAATETFVYACFGSGGYFPGRAYGLLVAAILLRRFFEVVYPRAY